MSGLRAVLYVATHFRDIAYSVSRDQSFQCYMLYLNELIFRWPNSLKTVREL